MSLINQALKKEQQRRSLNLRDSSPEIPVYDTANAGNGLSPSTRKGNRSLSLLIGFSGVGLVLLLLGGAFVYFGKSYLSQLDSTPVVAQNEQSPSLASRGSPLTQTVRILEEIESDSAAAAESVEAVAAEPESQAPIIDAPVVDAPVIDAPVEDLAVDAETELAPPAEPEPQYDYKIQDFVDQLQVFGYRSAGDDSRLLMNGRVYKLNDIVDNERGLKFLGNEGENLIFEAPSGYRYSKPL